MKINSDDTVGGLRSLFKMEPFTLLSVIVGWAALSTTGILAKYYLSDLIAISDFYFGDSNTANFTPWGLIGGPVLFIVCILTIVSFITVWFAIVHRYNSVFEKGRTTWKENFVAVHAFAGDIFVYSLSSVLIVMGYTYLSVVGHINTAIAIGIGIYITGQLIPGMSLVMKDEISVWEPIFSGFSLSWDQQLENMLWVTLLIVFGLLLNFFVDLWLSIPSIAILSAALSVSIVHTKVPTHSITL